MENTIKDFKFDFSDFVTTGAAVMVGVILAGVVVNALIPRVSTKLSAYMSKPVIVAEEVTE